MSEMFGSMVFCLSIIYMIFIFQKVSCYSVIFLNWYCNRCLPAAVAAKHWLLIWAHEWIGSRIKASHCSLHFISMFFDMHSLCDHWTSCNPGRIWQNYLLGTWLRFSLSFMWPVQTHGATWSPMAALYGHQKSFMTRNA
jgi:hypothetical protein